MTDRQTSQSRWYHFTPDRFLLGLLLAIGFLLLSEWFCWFPFNERKGWTVLLAIALVGAELAIMLLWFIGAMILRRRFQFSIRSLLVLVVVVAIPCSWFMTKLREARKIRETAAAIRKAEGWVEYYFSLGDELGAVPCDGPPGPAWLRDLVGVEFLAEITEAGQRMHTGIRVTDDLIDDEEMALLGSCAEIKALHLGGSDITNDGLKHIVGMTKLEYLTLHYTQITDEGLEHLRGLSKLSRLNLSDTSVGDRGIKHIEGLENLRELWLDNTRLTDDGLKHLEGLRNLHTLSLPHDECTQAGVEKLQRALPDCEIF